MTTPRRMGRKDTAAFNALLDATEKVLHDEGYGAATSRRIAAVAGVRQQLLYYYVETMEELLLLTFQRRTRIALDRLEKEIACDEPIQALWRFLTVTANGRLGFEFMALSNHHEGIRDEISRYVLEARKIGAAAIERQLTNRNRDIPLAPIAAAFLMDCASLMLRREEGAGIDLGHSELNDFMEWALRQLA